MANSTRTYFEVIREHKVALRTVNKAEAMALAVKLEAYLWQTETDYVMANHRCFPVDAASGKPLV